MPQEILVTVGASESTVARVELRDGGQGVKTYAGFVGKNGVTGSKREGDGKTPLGIFVLETAFGSGDVDTRMPYRKTTSDDVWVDDPRSRFYNTWRSRAGAAGWSSAENLLIPQYEYAVVVEYNTRPPVSGRGSAIFLHVNDRPTAGCVAVSRAAMREILAWLDPAKSPTIRIVIDEK